MSLDQYLSVKFIMWRIMYFKPKQAYITVSILCVLIIFLNFNILFTFGYIPENSNLTYSNYSKVICYSNSLYPITQWMATWGTVHLLIYSVFPFTLIIILNLTLIVFIFQRRKVIQPSSLSNEETSKAIGQTVMIASLLFVAFTLPSAFASHFFSDLIVTDIGSTYLIISNCLSFSYHSLGFFIYYFTNKIFCKEAQIVLKKIRERIKGCFLFKKYFRFSNF